MKGPLKFVSDENVHTFYFTPCYALSCYVMLFNFVFFFVASDMLSCVSLCCTMQINAKLCYVMLCHVILCYVMLCYFIFWFATS